MPEDEVKTYKAEPEDGQPVVGSGPFRLVEGTGRRLDVPVRGQPRLLAGRPAHRRGRLPGLQERGPDDPGADQGRGRLRRGHHAAPGGGAEGQRRHHRARRATRPGFDEIAFNTGVDRPRDRRADRRPEPGACWTRRSGTRWASRSTATRSSSGPTRAPASPASTIIPPAYDRLPLGAARGRGLRPTTRSGPAELLDEAGYTVGDDGFRTMPNGDPIGKLRLYRPLGLGTTSLDVMDFFQEWLADVGIDSEVDRDGAQQADRHDPRGRRSTPSSGAGTSSPTRPRCSAT